MLKQLRNGRFLLLLCIVSMLAAGVPAVIGVFQLIHLRGSVEQIERADAVSSRARDILEVLGHSLSSFTAIFVDLTPDERVVLLEEADQQFATLEPTIKEFRAAAVGFLSDTEADKLSKSIELIIHSWTDIREEVGNRTSSGEETYHFLKTLKNIRNARQILVSLERDTTELAETATKTSFERIERVTLYLFFAMSGGALIGLIAVFGNYQFAQSVRQTNKELLQKNVEIAKRDHQSIAQNECFDAALNNMSQGLCMFDGEQRLIVCNERYASLYGLPSDLVRPGTTFREILQYRVDNEVFAGGSPEEYIDERVAAVAEEVTSTKIQTLTDGRIIAIFHQPMPGGGWVATHEDITELRTAEEALRKSEELSSAAFKASPVPLSITDPVDGSYYDVNESWISALDYSREEAVGSSACALGVWVNPEDRKRFIDRITNKGFVRDFETKFRTKNGAELDILAFGEYLDVGGEPRLLMVAQDITERKRAENALRESEELFSKAFQASPAACAISNPDDGSHYDVNETWMALLGYTREEAMANTVHELGIWAEPDLRSRFVDQLKKEGSVRAYEAKFRTKNGAELDVLVSGEYVEAGGEARLFVVSRDITDRKKAEEALLESEARFRAFFDNTPICLNLKDTEGRYLLANKGYEEWWGCSAEEVIGKKADEFQDDCFGVQNMTEVELAVLETGTVHEKEIKAKRPADESVCDRLLIKFPVKSVDGSISAIGTVAIDITERKQAEQKIRTSQQRFRDVVETASDWIWECDVDLKFTFLSERYTEVTGLPVEKVIGRTRHDISKGAQVDPGSDWKSHFADLEARRAFRDFRYNITTSSGETLHFSISGTPVIDDSGNFAGYRGTGADTTSEMRAQAELIRHRDSLQQMVDTATADLQAKAEQLRHALEREKQLNEQQRQFISMASHEFRTPLAVIDGLVQRMIRRKDRLLPDELEMRANKIRGAVGTITTLMESTLTAAKMDSGKASINVGTVDLRQVIDEICRRQLLVDGNHKILRDLDALPDAVIGDRGALDQVFTNLLSNALKYSPDGTDVAVKGWCEGKTAIISVQDKGLGIDEEDLPKMFTRFFRAKTSTGIPGTGIGLNLVKALVELHDGKISVQSRKGLGSIFTVQLPLDGPSRDERSGGRAA